VGPIRQNAMTESVLGEGNNWETLHFAKICHSNSEVQKGILKRGEEEGHSCIVGMREVSGLERKGEQIHLKTLLGIPLAYLRWKP